MANTGKDYELFVASLQQALLEVENVTEGKNIVVEVNKIITDNCGIKREFDIYWQYEIADLSYKTVIECKDYNSKVSVDKIDALIGKTQDIPDLKLVFATKVGYQSGAETKARQHKIDLLVVREQNDSDWYDVDGEPLLKKIHINLCLNIPPHIHEFIPTLDAQWIKQETDIDTSKPIKISGLNKEIFIQDVDRNETYSLNDLAGRLKPVGGKDYGRFKITEKLDNAFILYGAKKYKIVSYDIGYTIVRPREEHIEIDFSKELIGVIEYLQKGTKTSVFNGQVIKRTSLSTKDKRAK